MRFKLFPELKPLELDYTSREFQIGDTLPIVYTDCKLSILLSDGLSAVMGGQALPTARGDLLTFHPSELHFGRIFRSGVHRFLDIYIPENYFSLFPLGCDSVMRLFLDPSPQRINRIDPGAERAAVLEHAERLIRLTEHPAPGAELEIFCRIMELLMLAVKLYDQQKGTPTANHLPRVVTTSIRYIDQHFSEPVSLNDLAEKAGCSVTYLTRSFKQSTGKTVHSYLTEARLHEAQRLLSGGCSVTEACFCSGFNDCSAFIKVFRRHLGMTPAQYRQAGKKE